jgi:hypothetical protein
MESKLTLVVATTSLALLGIGAIYAQKYTLKVPGGLASGPAN